MNNVVNIADKTPYKPKDFKHVLVEKVDLQDLMDAYNEVCNENENRKCEIKHLEKKIELLQEQLQNKKGWGKWINYKR